MNTCKTRKPFLPVLALITLLTIAFTGCGNLKYESEETFKSPSGEKEVVVKIDYVSRPDVFYNGACVFEYQGSAFMEDVPWNVKWNSEDEIELYLDRGDAKYQNERYVIELN